MLLLLSGKAARSHDIFEWDDLMSYYSNPTATTLDANLMQHLSGLSADMGPAGASLTRITIQGNGFLLDGNNHSGFNTALTLNFSDVTLRNFKQAVKTLSGKLNLSQNVVFRGNHSNDEGGAIHALTSSQLIGAPNSVIAFERNISDQDGGAVFLDIRGAGSSFDLSNVSFSSNTAIRNGGAIFISAEASNMSFTRSQVFFSSNSAVNGGAVFIDDQSSKLSFEGGNTTFELNKARDNGGAIFISNNSEAIFTNALVNFIGNDAHKGGAIYAAQNSTITFDSGNIVFEGNNTSNNGGAFYIEDAATINFNSRVQFKNNSSNLKGGAVYIAQNANVTFNASDDISFEGNTASSLPNDIFIDNNATLTLNVLSAASVHINGAVEAENNNSRILKRGSGIFALDGNINFSGKLVIEQGKVLIPATQQAQISVDVIEIKSYASLVKSNLEKLQVSNMTVESNATVDINIGSNYVIESIGDITFEDGSILYLSHYGLGLGRREVPVLLAYNRINFNNVQIKGSNTMRNFSYEIRDMPLGQELIVRFDQSLRSVRGLSHNQGEIYDLLNNDSASPVWNLMIPVQLYSDAKARRLLDELSGAFILNAIKSQLTGLNPSVLNYEIDTIRNDPDNASRNVWGRLHFEGQSFDHEDNDMDKFSYRGFGIMGGSAFYKEQTTVAGFFADISQKNFSQGSNNEATSLGADFGVYSAYDMRINEEIVNLKASASLGFANIKSKRTVRIGASDDNYGTVYFVDKTAHADFYVLGLKYILSAEYVVAKTIGKYGLILKPFMDFQGGFLFNEKITERNGDEINLIIAADTYSRLEWLAGFRIGKTYDFYRWDFKAGFGYLLIGNNSLYDVKIRSLSNAAAADIRATKENPFFFTFGGYGEYAPKPQIGLFLDIDIKIGRELFGYYAAVGANYKFKAAPKPPKPPKATKPKAPKKKENVGNDTLGQDDILEVQELLFTTLEGSIFKENSYELTPAAKEHIKELAQRIRAYRKNYKVIEIIVEGYAEQEEVSLSNASMRAKAVAQELAKYGLRVVYKANPTDDKQPKRIELRTEVSK